MIDHNLPEPPVEDRECAYCRRRKGLKGNLIHWPAVDFTRDKVVMPSGMEIEPFSIWLYSCQWCRAAESRRRNRAVKTHG